MNTRLPVILTLVHSRAYFQHSAWSRTGETRVENAALSLNLRCEQIANVRTVFTNVRERLRNLFTLKIPHFRNRSRSLALKKISGARQPQHHFPINTFGEPKHDCIRWGVEMLHFTSNFGLPTSNFLRKSLRFRKISYKRPHKLDHLLRLADSGRR